MKIKLKSLIKEYIFKDKDPFRWDDMPGNVIRVNPLDVTPMADNPYINSTEGETVPDNSMQEGVGDWAGWGRETPEQQKCVKYLDGLGFERDTHSPEESEEDPYQKIVIMMSRKIRHSTRYAEIGSDGSVNGESLEDFIKSLR